MTFWNKKYILRTCLNLSCSERYQRRLLSALCHSWFVFSIFWIWRSIETLSFRAGSPAYCYYENFNKSVSFPHLRQKAKRTQLTAGLSLTRHHFIKYFLLLFHFFNIHLMSALKPLYFPLLFTSLWTSAFKMSISRSSSSPHLGVEIKDQRAWR